MEKMKKTIAMEQMEPGSSDRRRSPKRTIHKTPMTAPTAGRNASIRFLSSLFHLFKGQGRVMKLPQAMKKAVM